MSIPWRVQLVSAVARRVPRGRYRLLPLAGSRGTFVASLAPDAGGARFHCDLADLICREVCVTGLYEPPVSRLIQALLPSGGTMIDVGANWGYFTLLAAAGVGAGGTVVALEPDPRQFEVLCANVALNSFGTIVTMQTAVGAREHRSLLEGYLDTATNRGVSRVSGSPVAHARAFEVRCVPLDGVSVSHSKVDVVKIDVEGAETDVIAGMTDGLRARRYRAIILELHPALLGERGQDPGSLLRTLEAFGYRGWTIDCTASAYRRASDPSITAEAYLRRLDDWRDAPWPHLLWRC